MVKPRSNRRTLGFSKAQTNELKKLQSYCLTFTYNVTKEFSKWSKKSSSVMHENHFKDIFGQKIPYRPCIMKFECHTFSDKMRLK